MLARGVGKNDVVCGLDLGDLFFLDGKPGKTWKTTNMEKCGKRQKLFDIDGCSAGRNAESQSLVGHANPLKNQHTV